MFDYTALVRKKIKINYNKKHKTDIKGIQRYTYQVYEPEDK